MNIKQLFLSMSRIRIVEELIAEKYKEQKMRCPTHLSIGQELPASVICGHLKNSDYAISTHRSHAHYLAKGGSINGLIAELHGKKTGCSKGIGGSMHLQDQNVNFMGSSAIVGNSIPIGVGFALSSKLRNEKRISAVFFGEGATEQGVFFESLNFAAVFKLPVAFICENNLYSVYSNREFRQTSERSIVRIAKELGVHAQKLSFTSDIPTIISEVEQTLSLCRGKELPILFEFETYRHREHCGPNFDDNLNYRDNSETEHYFLNDPLIKVETLINNGPSDNNEILRYKSRIHSETLLAFEAASEDGSLNYDELKWFQYHSTGVG